MNLLKNKTLEILNEFSEATMNEFNFGNENNNNQLKNLINKKSENLEDIQKNRLQNEFYSFGPLVELFSNESITEILIHGSNSIWYEINGNLTQHDDIFFSNFTFDQFVIKICDESHNLLNLENPIVDGKFMDYRLCIIDKSITHSETTISFRRHPKQVWNFEKLQNLNWCTSLELEILKNLISDKKNFLIIGTTGCGKTSVVNSCLQLTNNNERSVIIEDTDEIKVPNLVSIKLLTRTHTNGQLSCIDQNDLLKSALRLRPDRIILGEMRGSEAKDFLMALSTGHKGSFGTLHASDPHQALIRLEMLVQMGAPQWNLLAIRKLIFLSLDAIVVLEKTSQGERKLKGIYRLCSLEENGFLIEQMN